MLTGQQHLHPHSDTKTMISDSMLMIQGAPYGPYSHAPIRPY